jgi:hypothetical protein
MSPYTASRLTPPTANHIAEELILPYQDSATLSPPIMRWLESQGMTYVIPRVPFGFPPVRASDAMKLAATRTSVGPRPRIRELALVSPITVIPPLRAHHTYWAVVLSPANRASYNYFVVFITVYHPAGVVGSLHHVGG